MPRQQFWHGMDGADAHLVGLAAGDGQARKTPSGAMPARRASAASISTQAAAPSDSCEALPAVTNWPSPRTGLSAASAS